MFKSGGMEYISFSDYLRDKFFLAKYLTFDRLARIYRKFKLKYIYKTHLVDTNLEPGYQYAISELLLYSSFSLLSNYVEKNLAAEQIRQRQSLKFSIGYNDTLHLRKKYKDPLMGMAHLKEFISYDEASLEKKETAAEILILYHWWTNVRPKRADPEDMSGVVAFIKELDNKYGANTFHVYNPMEKLELDKKLDLCYTIEEEYEIEDDLMLLRLMKIRKDLLI